MFGKRGGAGSGGKSGGSAPPTTGQQATPTPTSSEAPEKIPEIQGQLPLQNQPLAPPTRGPDFGPGASNTETETETPEAVSFTLEQVLANPSLAEDRLHGSLMLRALRWLELLERDDNTPPKPGQRVVGLDTQVDMFKVIAEWLKTSKKTKGLDDEEGAPGIEQMRELIRQELEKVPEKPPAKPSSFMNDFADEDELGTEEDYEEATQPPEPRAHIAARGGLARGRKAGTSLAARGADSKELDAMLNRARKAAYEEDN